MNGDRISMTAKQQPPGARRKRISGSKAWQRLAKVWEIANSHALIVALVSAVIGGVITYLASPKNQDAANAVTINAAKAQQANALRRYADQVTYGLGPAPSSNSRSRTPQLIIENRSGGWVRNVTLIVPVPIQGKNGSIHLPGFAVVSGMVGHEMEGIGASGGFVSIQLANIPPCEIAVTALLTAIPSAQPAELAGSELEFTDQTGKAWSLHGDGRLVEGTDSRYDLAGTPSMPNTPNVSGWAWSSSGNFEPITGGCLSG
jgi:hypothetical protein